MIFRIGEETIPTIPVDKAELEDSPFRDAIVKARDRIFDICKETARQKEPTADNDSAFDPLKVKNNIIAFLGDRGSGKTSSMMTVREGLISAKEGEDKYGWKTVLNKNPDISLLFLDLIDPSFFDSRHNILEVLLGELFRNFKAKKAKWQSLDAGEREKLGILQGEFGAVKRALKFIQKRDDDVLIEEHEELQGLSEGVNLQDLIKKLIGAYLKCFGANVLVISIDDIDVNIKEAYVMMEQIRKYLILPNVIIMIAGKLLQLSQSIKLYYYKEVLPNNERHSNPKIMTDIAGIAERYLDKFLPLTHRIFMPESDAVASQPLVIIDTDNSKIEFGSTDFAILSMIFHKCGYLFYNYEDAPSLIIPRNLRELRLLATTLFTMKDRDGKVVEENRRAFKKYFFEQWLSELPEELQEMAECILAEQNMWQLNKVVVSLLADQFGLRVAGDDDEDTESGISGIEQSIRNRIREICNPENIGRNISVGDVMFVLQYIGQHNDTPEVRRFLFYVSSYYSILLYEYYDQLTSAPPTVEEQTKRAKLPKLRHTHAIELPEFYKLVGNNFFVLTGNRFLPEKNDRVPREVVMVNGAILRNQIIDLLKDISDNPDSYSDPEKLNRLRLVEFFVLTISRRVVTKDASYDVEDIDNWRTDSALPYFMPFNPGVKNILFEVTAPFVNMIEPHRAYERFHKDFYNAVKDLKGSLAYDLINHRRNKHITQPHDLMSQVAIRNTEVLADLEWWMEDHRSNLRPGDAADGDMKILADFYNRFKDPGEKRDYRVWTYNQKDNVDENTGTGTPEEKENNEAEKIENPTPHKYYFPITFQPLALLGKCLISAMESEELVALFRSIYNPAERFGMQRTYTIEEVLSILNDRGLNSSLFINTIKQDYPDGQFLFSAVDICHIFLVNNVWDPIILTEILEPDLYRVYFHMVEDYLGRVLSEVEAKVRDIKAESGRLEKYIADRSFELKEYQAELTQIKKDIAAREKKIIDLSKQLAAESGKENLERPILEAEIHDFQGEKQKLINRSDTLTSWIDDVRNQIRATKEVVGQLNKDLQMADGERSEMERDHRQIIQRLRTRR